MSNRLAQHKENIKCSERNVYKTRVIYDEVSGMQLPFVPLPSGPSDEASSGLNAQPHINQKVSEIS